MNMKAMSIEDRVAVVTGAASGIGSAVATALAGRGAKGLALVDRSDAVVEMAEERDNELWENATKDHIERLEDRKERLCPHLTEPSTAAKVAAFLADRGWTPSSAGADGEYLLRRALHLILSTPEFQLH